MGLVPKSRSTCHPSPDSILVIFAAVTPFGVPQDAGELQLVHARHEAVQVERALTGARDNPLPTDGVRELLPHRAWIINEEMERRESERAKGDARVEEEVITELCLPAVEGARCEASIGARELFDPHRLGRVVQDAEELQEVLLSHHSSHDGTLQVFIKHPTRNVTSMSGGGYIPGFTG